MEEWTNTLRVVIEARGLAQAAKFIRDQIPKQFHEYFKIRAVEIKNEQ